MQKALILMNLKLTSVLDDITGVTDGTIMKAFNHRGTEDTEKNKMRS